MNTQTSQPLRVLGQGARGILDEFVDLIQIVSLDGTFLYVNRAWRDRLGYSEDDALGMGFLDIIHPEHQAAWKSIFKSVLAGERLDNFEMVLMPRDGSPIPVEGSVWCRQPEGELSQVCAVFRDSVARALGEQRLSRRLYRDEQTSLYNAAGFAVRAMALLETVEENRERLGAWLLYIEINNFDAIARQHGEAAMEDSILRTADVLKRAMRAHDVVARLSRAGFVALVSLPPRYQPGYVTARVKGGIQLANRQANKPWNVELALGLVALESVRALDEGLRLARAQALHNAARRAEA